MVDSNLPEDNVQANEAPTSVEMPEVDPSFGYLLELFFLSGQAMSTGMGLVPLSWQEMKAFIEVNKLKYLTLWEIGTLKRMSDAYCSEYNQASEPSRQAPYRNDIDIEDVVDLEEDDPLVQQVIMKKTRVATSFRDTLRALGKK